MRLKTLFEDGSYHRMGFVLGRICRVRAVSGECDHTVAAISDRCVIELTAAGIVEIPDTRTGRRWETKP